MTEEAAKRLIDFEEEGEEPQLIEIIDGQKVANAAVTLDGTWPWQRKGHSSKIGVVLVVSVRTGEVLDYEVLNLVCHECQCHEKELPKINYKVSSGEMESAGGCILEINKKVKFEI